MNKTPWFQAHEKPVRSGVYLTNRVNLEDGSDHYSWRAFDGVNWRFGVLAVANGQVRETPDYGYMIATHRELPKFLEDFRWCGIVL